MNWDVFLERKCERFRCWGAFYNEQISSGGWLCSNNPDANNPRHAAPLFGGKTDQSCASRPTNAVVPAAVFGILVSQISAKRPSVSKCSASICS